ncbi:MAG: 3-deoxy-D-manno-octulosonic acid transferase, partial [Alphaproteobacteria bacterium]|nr:3-deoxy-D-manno-octulosonic acid transferase [Alphaproteobacteria bacterium]
ATRRNGAKMLLVNARMSEASFHNWQRFPRSIEKLLSVFDAILAQAPQDAARLTALGAQNVQMPGNLKEDAGDLPFDAAELARLKAQIGNRPLWLAASTHSGEESLIAAAHKQLLAEFPNLLTMIVPRHPPRGEKIATELESAGLSVALRSRGDAITAGTAIYLADTIGELGLFYRLADVVFMGGSLIPHGGQNPLEAARLDCALLAGEHTHNFEDIYARFASAPALIRVADSATLAAAVEKLLSDSLLRDTLAANAKQEIRTQQGALAATLDAAAAFLVKRKRP